MDHDRRLAPSPFPGDSGEASPDTRRLLTVAAASASPEDYLRAVAGLCGERLLVPVVATTTRSGTTVGGLTSDKEAEMAVAMLQASDGRRAMVAFTGVDTLGAWRSDARPVPVTLDVAAKSARTEGAAAVIVDVAGPHSLALEGDILDRLAAGHRLIETERDVFGWAVPTSGG